MGKAFSVKKYIGYFLRKQKNWLETYSRLSLGGGWGFLRSYTNLSLINIDARKLVKDTFRDKVFV